MEISSGSPVSTAGPVDQAHLDQVPDDVFFMLFNAPDDIKLRSRDFGALSLVSKTMHERMAFLSLKIKATVAPLMGAFRTLPAHYDLRLGTAVAGFDLTESINHRSSGVVHNLRNRSHHLLQYSGDNYQYFAFDPKGKYFVGLKFDPFSPKGILAAWHLDGTVVKSARAGLVGTAVRKGFCIAQEKGVLAVSPRVGDIFGLDWLEVELKEGKICFGKTTELLANLPAFVELFYNSKYDVVICVCEQEIITIRSPFTQPVQESLPRRAQSRCYAYAEEAGIIAYEDRNRGFVVFDLANRQPRFTIPLNNKEDAFHCHVQASRLFLCTETIDAGYSGITDYLSWMNVWNIGDGQPITRFSMSLNDDKRRVTDSTVYLPAQNWCVTSFWGTICIWDMVDGQLVKTIELGKNITANLGYDPSAKQLFLNVRNHSGEYTLTSIDTAIFWTKQIDQK